MFAHVPNLCGAAVPRLLIVGDIALFREGIETGLARTGQFQMIGAVDIAEAVRIVEQESIDVVVLDTSRKNAASQARALIQACSRIRIVAFGVGAIEDALECAEAGVRAFVDEDGSINAIRHAVMEAVRGLSVCPPQLTAGLLDRYAEIANRTHMRRSDRLTDRENQIARMVAVGMSNKQIARELSISPATVKNHVHAILGKFDLSRRSAIGHQLGWQADCPR